MNDALDPNLLQYGAAGLAVLLTIIFFGFSLKALAMLQRQAEATEARYRALVETVLAFHEKRETAMITTVQDNSRAMTELTVAIRSQSNSV